MKLRSFPDEYLDLKSASGALSERGLHVADYIADSLRKKKLGVPVGKFIYHVCQVYGVEHYRVARHLGMRTKQR